MTKSTYELDFFMNVPLPDSVIQTAVISSETWWQPQEWLSKKWSQVCECTTLCPWIISFSHKMYANTQSHTPTQIHTDRDRNARSDNVRITIWLCRTHMAKTNYNTVSTRKGLYPTWMHNVSSVRHHKPQGIRGLLLTSETQGRGRQGGSLSTAGNKHRRSPLNKSIVPPSPRPWRWPFACSRAARGVGVGSHCVARVTLWGLVDRPRGGVLSQAPWVMLFKRTLLTVGSNSRMAGDCERHYSTHIPITGTAQRSWSLSFSVITVMDWMTSEDVFSRLRCTHRTNKTGDDVISSPGCLSRHND